MIIPTQQQIERITTLLQTSIQELIDNDSDIFNIDIIMPQQISDDARILNRELHETTINHRLAYYLEKNIHDTELHVYKVDIEYNRFYDNPKLVQTVDGLIAIRPDILMHSRIDDTITPQHFLVIEAKKGQITIHDINKVKGLISDDHYNYVFGFTISYCGNDNYVMGNLFFYDGTDIIPTTLNVNKEKQQAT